MAKKYNLSKNLDMKHFERDITNKVHSIAEDAIAPKIYEIECPHCHKKVSVPSGFGYCPECHEPINVDVKVTWR